MVSLRCCVRNCRGVATILLVVALSTGFASQAHALCAPTGNSTVSELPDFACMNAMQASELYTSPATYRIVRKGKRIGKHTITIASQNSSEPSTVNVEVASRIRVTILKVPVFSFDYKAKESWQNDTLMEVEATTTENSNTTRVSATRDAAGFVLKSDGRSETVTGLEFATNHWHPGALRTTSLFNTLTGKQNEVRVEKLERELLELPAGTMHATHFRYSGGLRAEVWYDDKGKWVQLKFKGDDGSNIFYKLDKS